MSELFSGQQIYADIDLKKIKYMIVTHGHSDHVLGTVWIFRMIATMIKNKQYDIQPAR